MKSLPLTLANNATPLRRTGDGDSMKQKRSIGNIAVNQRINSKRNYVDLSDMIITGVITMEQQST